MLQGRACKWRGQPAPCCWRRLCPLGSRPGLGPAEAAPEAACNRAEGLCNGPCGDDPRPSSWTVELWEHILQSIPTCLGRPAQAPILAPSSDTIFQCILMMLSVLMGVGTAMRTEAAGLGRVHACKVRRGLGMVVAFQGRKVRKGYRLVASM